MKIFSLLWIILAVCMTHASAVEVEVKVYEQGTNAIEARTRALESAEKRGFAAIIKQKAEDDAASILENYEGYNVSQYVLGYHSRDEIVTDTSYRAVITLDFDDNFIRSVIQQPLAQKAVMNAGRSRGDEKFSRSAILVVPIMRTNNDIKLWEDDNIWREYIKDSVLQLGYGNYVVAYGDSKDRLRLSKRAIENANFALFLPLLERYGAEHVLIATIMERGLEGFSVITREISSSNENYKTAKIELEAGDDARSILKEQADLLISEHLKKRLASKGSDQLEATELHTIEAFLKHGGSRDWNKLRNRLQNVSSIEKMDVVNADVKGMTMAITFRGRPEVFGKQLVENGISATQRDEQLIFGIR